MVSNLIVAVCAIIPLFFLMLIGVAVKKMKLLTELELAHVNRMVFKIFFFFMMFYNIYTTDIAETFRPHLILFGALGVLASALIGGIIICLLEKSNKRRGAMIQAIFRSNFVIMGIPIISNIFGDDQLAIPTMMIAIIVPIYNIVSVFILETFRGGHFYLPGILLGVLKNPMILGAILGFSMLLLGIPLPKVILKPVSQLDSLDDGIALTDIATYDFLFLNHAMLRMMHLPDTPDAYKGKKCYELLAGRAAPCADCANSILARDAFRTCRRAMRFTSGSVLQHDTLVPW